MKTVQHVALSFLALTSALPLVASAAAQTVESVAVPAQIRCNTTAGGGIVFAVHADKIVFRLAGALAAVNPANQPALDQIPRNTELDIKVLDNPLAIADLRGKILSFMGAVDNAAARANVDVLQVTYAMVCPVKAFTTPAGE